MHMVVRSTDARATAWVVMVAGGGAASLAAGWIVGTLLFPASSPAQTVAARFPAEWTDTYTPPPTEVAEQENAASPQWLASMAPPKRPGIYAAAESQDTAPQWLALVAPQPGSPITPVAYFADTPASEPIEVAAVEPAEPQARVRMASAGPMPMPQAKPAVIAKVDPRRGHVFNDKQIASIKKRLALTPDQEQYWPTIEGALREVKWKRGEKRGTQSGHQMAQVDTSRVDMERLKSIAVPLVMSFREDQKRELRSLAHLMGLNDVASAL